MTLRALLGAFFFVYFVCFTSMTKITFDFQIIGRSDVPGISLIVAQNEDAFSYLTEEEDLAYLADGSVPLATEKLSDFIFDAERCHMSSALV